MAAAAARPAAEVEESIRRTCAPDSGDTPIEPLIQRVEECTEFLENQRRQRLVEMQKNAARFRCPNCGNADQSNFIQDVRSGDTICIGLDGTGCGTVVQDRRVHEGSQYRCFEGEEDRSHHGSAPDPLFSSSHNSRTNMTGGIGSDSKAMVRANALVEQGLSNIGKDEHRTREWYKDQHKLKAGHKMQQVAHTLDLHDMVVERAKVLFAALRNDREHLTHFELSVAACLIAARRQLHEEIDAATTSSRLAEARALAASEKRKRRRDQIEQRGSEALQHALKRPARDDEPSTSSRAGGAAAADDAASSAVAVVHWDESLLQQWLATLPAPADGAKARFASGILAAVRDSSTTAKPRTLGQLLMLGTLDRFAEYSAGDESSSKAIHESLQVVKKREDSSRQKQSNQRSSARRFRQAHQAKPGKAWVADLQS